MADYSPETSSDNTEGELSSPEEQTAQIVNQKIMGEIQQLLEQDKYTVLLRVIELSIQHVNQRKEITTLQQHVKKVLEERVQIKNDLIVQHNFKTNLQSVEDVKYACSIRLREKLETINAHIKSNDAIRSNLKEDDAAARLEMEEIKKLMNELTEKANTLQRTLQEGEFRFKELNQQLHIAAVETSKLQHDCHAKECEINSVSSKHAEIMQQLKNELMERESSIKQRADELKREQHNSVKQATVFEQLTSELTNARNDIAQLKQTVENELSKEEQHFRKQIAFSEKSFEDMKQENEKLLESMSNIVTALNEQNKATKERIDELTRMQSDLTNDLQCLNDCNSKLKQKLNDYNRNKQLEITRLKESIKASKANAAASAANKPSLPWSIRPKRQVFTKSSKNSNEAAAKQLTTTILCDSDQSSAFDTSVYFEGKL